MSVNTVDELDNKANEVFGGKVVRKDLVRQVRSGGNVPVYVLEYLLGKYCASDDPDAIEAGLRVVNNTLSENYVRPDEANKARAKVKQLGEYEFIDKVKVRLIPSQNKYWAELVNFGYKQVHIPDDLIFQFERVLEGGVWAIVKVEYREEETGGANKEPFFITELKPIQVAYFSGDDYQIGRQKFTTDEWIDLLIRSIGLDAEHFDRRLKLMMLTRLIPMCEANYNMVELGPRGTGKSYAYQEISPYSILMTGSTTVANLFYNMATNRIGLVGIWDAVAFDEVADLQKMSKEVITMLKTYCESGRFARGRETLEGKASLALFGNTNQPVEVLVRSSHLFQPMPEIIREDMAFLDRIHYYIPGWEVPKMQTKFFTDHYGFVVDYFAEALRDLRKHNFTEIIDQHYSLGSHLNARDVKAVRKTVAGLAKILYPHRELTKEELAEVLEVALEGRRRVKEQLKKMGAFEYYQTSFSYIDQETREEHFVGVPEMGGQNLIAQDPLDPGSVYFSSVNAEGKVGLYRLEVGCSPGTGKLKLSGSLESSMKESLKRAFDYVKGSKVEMGIGQQFDSTDFHVEAVDLLANKVPAEAGVALVVAIESALKKQSTIAGLVILGDLSIQGNIKPISSLAEPLQVAMDNGARKALIPISNKRHFLEVSPDIVEQIDPIFFGDPLTAARKALGLS